MFCGPETNIGGQNILFLEDPDGPSQQVFIIYTKSQKNRGGGGG